MEPMRTMLRTAAVSGVLALALTACVPSEPSVADWRSSTSQALEDTAREVGELLSRASDLVREARIALTAGDESSYAELRRQLTDLADEVDTAREGLR